MDKNLDQLKEQYRLLGEEISKLEAAPKRWRGLRSGLYFFMDSVGDICSDLDLKQYGDDYRHRIGNYFQTEEEAEKWKEWNDTICELRAFSDGVDGNRVIYYNEHNDEYICVFRSYTPMRDGCIRFSTKERAEEAIKHFGSRLDVIYR